MHYFKSFILIISLILQSTRATDTDSYPPANNSECLDYDECMYQYPEFRIKEFSKPMGSPQYMDNEEQILPWYTKPFLDVLLTWDIKDWEIFEWGSGHSTIWYALHCRSITSIECYPKWQIELEKSIQELDLKNAIIKLRKPNPYANFHLSIGGQKSAYVLAIEEDNKMYDCIIIDGMHRNACAEHVLAHLKPGGIIIVDNANQKSIGIDSGPTFQLFQKFEHHSYLQIEDCKYSDWRTDYWIGPK